MTDTEIGVLVAFWVVLGLGLVVIAIHRQRRRYGYGGSRTGEPAFAWGIGALFVVFGLAVPAVALIVTTDNSKSSPTGATLTAAQLTGRQLFAHNCSNCHTLSAANAAGRVGPNLDQIQPNEALILNAIEQGRARGNGVMPAGLVSGQDAQDVADYVSAVAGH